MPYDFVKKKNKPGFHRQIALCTKDADTKCQRAPALIRTTTTHTGKQFKCKLLLKSN